MVVMFADLDKFKQVNDTLGHAMGDEVLQRFAGILKDSIRSSDVAARLGGDEFVILLCDASLDDAREAAERIQQNVNTCAEAHGIDCSVSIGIGEAPTHGKTLDDILARVDEAMYQLKLSNNRGSIQCAVPQPQIS
jgi:diguanylate cyclase (GGDEF)-like protein